MLIKTSFHDLQNYLFSESIQCLDHSWAASFSGDLRKKKTDQFKLNYLTYSFFYHLCIGPSHLCENPARVHRHHKHTRVSQVHRQALDQSWESSWCQMVINDQLCTLIYQRPSLTCWVQPWSTGKRKVHLQCFQQCLQQPWTSAHYSSFYDQHCFKK